MVGRCAMRSDDQREMLLLQTRRAVCGRHPCVVWVGWNGCPALDSSALPAPTYISDSEQSRAGFCTAVLRLVLATARVFRIYLRIIKLHLLSNTNGRNEFYQTRIERLANASNPIRLKIMANRYAAQSLQEDLLVTRTHICSAPLTCKRFRVDQRPMCSSAHYYYFFTLPLPVPFCICVAVHGLTGHVACTVLRKDALCFSTRRSRCRQPTTIYHWRWVCTCLPFVFLSFYTYGHDWLHERQAHGSTKPGLPQTWFLCFSTHATKMARFGFSCTPAHASVPMHIQTSKHKLEVSQRMDRSRLPRSTQPTNLKRISHCICVLFLAYIYSHS